MNVGFVYGEHGRDEPFSTEVGTSLEKHPIAGVVPIPANRLAYELGDRWVDVNMAASYRDANLHSVIHEQREAAGVLYLRQKYDLDFLISFHSSHYPGNDSAWLNPRSSRLAIEVALFLGFKDLIVTDYSNICSVESDSIMLEISDDHSNPRFDVDYWRCELKDLVGEFVYDDVDEIIARRQARLWVHLGVIKLSEAGLYPEDLGIQSLRKLFRSGFSPIPEEVTGSLGLLDGYGRPLLNTSTMTWGDKYADKDILGELLHDVPPSETARCLEGRSTLRQVYNSYRSRRPG